MKITIRNQKTKKKEKIMYEIKIKKDKRENKFTKSGAIYIHLNYHLLKSGRSRLEEYQPLLVISRFKLLIQMSSKLTRSY